MLTSSTNQSDIPQPSALTILISNSTAETPSETLSEEILYNLRYQHKWTDLQLLSQHQLSTPRSSPSPSPTTRRTRPTPLSRIVSDLDLGDVATSSSPAAAAAATTDEDEDQTPLRGKKSTTTRSKQPEAVPLPVLISGLPPRHSYIHPDFLAHLVQHDIPESDVPVQREWVMPMSVGEKWTLKRFAFIFDSLPEREAREGVDGFRHQDSKRVLLAMLGHNGMGGDGTVVYYIMQEGEVKPRQN